MIGELLESGQITEDFAKFLKNDLIESMAREQALHYNWINHSNDKVNALLPEYKDKPTAILNL